MNNTLNELLRFLGGFEEKLTGHLREALDVSAALSDLREVDALLTQISRTHDNLSKADLKRIGNSAFDAAEKYGIRASDYLSLLQNLSLAGYENAESLAELSAAVQAAGSMTAETAGRMVIAADEAYQMNGSLKELSQAMDGMNQIADRHALDLTQLAEGLSIVGSAAAASGVDIKETAAALGAMITAARTSGAEAADAFRAILLFTRQTADEEAGIDGEGLRKYEKACSALQVKLRETREGILSLRDPMEVLKELSEAYSRLGDGDERKTALRNALGSQEYAAQLDALLNQWPTYENMLRQYADGTGSIAAAAEENADSWEGSLNRLSHTWTEAVGNIADSGAILSAVNALNELLKAVNQVTGFLGPLGTIGLGAGLFAGIKNVGRDKRSSLFML